MDSVAGDGGQELGDQLGKRMGQLVLCVEASLQRDHDLDGGSGGSEGAALLLDPELRDRDLVENVSDAVWAQDEFEPIESGDRLCAREHLHLSTVDA